jgi:hypothetical protein
MSIAPQDQERENQRVRLQSLYEARRFQDAADLGASLATRWADSYHFHLLRGLALMELRHFEDAITCFEKALALKPGHHQAVESMAWCIGKVGRSDDALATFAEIFYTTPTHNTATALLRVAFDATEQDRPLMDMLLAYFYPNYFQRHPDHYIVLSRFTPFAEWCAANGVTFDTYDPGGDTYLTLPDGTPVPPYHAPPVQFAKVPGAGVIAGLDWLIAPNGEFLDGSGLTLFKKMTGQRFVGVAFVPFASDPPRNRVLHPRTKSEIHIDEDVLFLSAPLLHHFGHWVADHLPRLMAWRQAGKAPLKIFTLASLPEAQRETLAHFGVQAADMIEAPEDGQFYRFRSITTLNLGDTQRPAPILPKFLYSGLALKKTPLSREIPGGRYFLERSQTHRGRDIANREELQAVLDEFGFEVIRRPELSVAEQDVKFSEASIILSPFGSDTVTFFQIRPGTDFVVLNFENMEQVYPDIEAVLPRYCALLGMWYHAIACGLAPREGKMLYHGDMIVDCGALRRTLTAIVARRAGQH